MRLETPNNWFLNISSEKITKKDVKPPLFLTEHIEYIKYMTKEGKYENSKGHNEFYLSQVEVSPDSWVFGLRNNPEEDDLENLIEYLQLKRQLKFQSHEKWGKSYSREEIFAILRKENPWYITEAPFMKQFYKKLGYDGFITEEDAGYDKPFENICILNSDKINTIEQIPIKDLDLDIDSDFLKKYDESFEPKSFARMLAQIAHDDVGQKRRKTGEPYWTHTQSVADIVESFGGSDEQIIAAELHDTLEDTDLTLDIIEENFSNKVRDIVLELTNDEKKIKEIGKEQYMNRKLVNLSKEALLVKLADFYHNLSSQPGPRQLPRMISNIKYLTKHRKLSGKNKEICNSIIQFIKSSK